MAGSGKLLSSPALLTALMPHAFPRDCSRTGMEVSSLPTGELRHQATENSSGSPQQGLLCPFLIRLQSYDADLNRKPGCAGTSSPCFTTGHGKEAPCFPTLPTLFPCWIHCTSPATCHFEEPLKPFLNGITIYFSISTGGSD